ncbi:nucleoside-diphosphate kinase [Paenibacillus sp. HJGM_3]|uniref:nucleoside-diphosphate kinase n=1 Tax=Paenibacillus sp. HJGM_3 TaxID=3379816 RepID=UPI00385CD066
MERTFLMIKPDGVERGLIGEVVSRFERRGFQLVGCKLMQVSKELAEKHYAEHVGRPYYEDLMQFITSGPVFAMVWEGDQVIALSRIMMGKTNTLEAVPGTIRGDFAIHTNRNIIHGSDSPENATREINLFFRPEELLTYTKVIQKWI